MGFEGRYSPAERDSFKGKELKLEPHEYREVPAPADAVPAAPKEYSQEEQREILDLCADKILTLIDDENAPAMLVGAKSTQHIGNMRRYLRDGTMLLVPEDMQGLLGPAIDRMIYAALRQKGFLA